MLNVIEREVVRKLYFFSRPIRNWQRSRAFAKTEAAGTDLSGTFDEGNLRRSDLNSY